MPSRGLRRSDSSDEIVVPHSSLGTKIVKENLRLVLKTETDGSILPGSPKINDLPALKWREPRLRCRNQPFFVLKSEHRSQVGKETRSEWQP
jgi:hypothetical protein